MAIKLEGVMVTLFTGRSVAVTLECRHEGAAEALHQMLMENVVVMTIGADATLVRPPPRNHG